MALLLLQELLQNALALPLESGYVVGQALAGAFQLAVREPSLLDHPLLLLEGLPHEGVHLLEALAVLAPGGLGSQGSALLLQAGEALPRARDLQLQLPEQLCKPAGLVPFAHQLRRDLRAGLARAAHQPLQGVRLPRDVAEDVAVRRGHGPQVPADRPQLGPGGGLGLAAQLVLAEARRGRRGRRGRVREFGNVRFGRASRCGLVSIPVAPVVPGFATQPAFQCCGRWCGASWRWRRDWRWRC
mmetsp:Transcript_83660/g.249655  ORF Transcript_83660/g.249655 Transcript_83660/m.249655 type:complete len:243 (-) Transcript_83660:904-1632(-)